MSGSVEGRAGPVARTTAIESAGCLSPDGQWLAFDSNLSGQSQVSVQGVGPAATARIPATTRVCANPRWSPERRTLYFVSGRRVWKVAADPKAGLFGEPQKVADFPRDVANVNDYDVAGDGRLIVLQGAETDSPLTELSVISNWPGRLRELVRAGERE